MKYNFEKIIDRVNSDSVKWDMYDADVLPMWVADMDFQSPQPVIDALTERVMHGVFGYPMPDKKLKDLIVERLYRLYEWKVKPGEIVFLPGVVYGFNNVIQALVEPGQGVLMQTPVYPPFLSAPENGGNIRHEYQLKADPENGYIVDFEEFEQSIKETTGMFLLCNPHNPVGKVFTVEELNKMAEICLRHNLVICSDEIHCDLIFNGRHHIPIASLSEEIARNTITLMAPSKTFNIAGLECAFAIVQNMDYLKKIKKAARGLISHVNIFGYCAATAAYEHGQEWLEQLLDYLTINRDYLVAYIREKIPGIKIIIPEGTYLAWLDCKDLQISVSPCQFFLDNARVAVNDGSTFGKGGEGFVRLNFGCPRIILEEGLDRMREAVNSI
jgi:cystathionine beta-lyase